MKSLILGGVKSGKSRFAEQRVKRWVVQADSSESSVIYLATAEYPQADVEFAERISRHKTQRPSNWKTIEEPLDISEIIAAASGKNQCLLIECLTLWVSNLLRMKIY